VRGPDGSRCSISCGWFVSDLFSFLAFTLSFKHPVFLACYGWNRSHGRRLFPFSRTRQHETLWSEVSDPLSADASDEPEHYMVEPIIPTLFDAPTASDGYSRVSPDAESRGDDVLIRTPRWRRRNMRAPEPPSMLSRHASPVIIYDPPTGSPTVIPVTRQDENEPPAPLREEPVAYPTPGSSENENLP